MSALHVQPPSSSLEKQRGLTLVELMVAMTLALAILVGVGYIYIQGKDGFRVQDNQARLQENARLVYTLISRDLLMAGHFGCVKVSTDTNLGVSNVRITASQPLMTSDISWLEADKNQTNKSRELDPGVVIQGYDNGAGWQVPSSISSKRLAQTDTIIILRGGDDYRHLTGPVVNEREFFITNPLPGTKDGIEPMVISNCATAEIIKPTALAGGTKFSVDNSSNYNTATTVADTFSEANTLIKADYYDTRSMVTRFEPVTYFVGLAKGSNGRNVPSLYRGVIQKSGAWDTSPDVVVEGVEQLRFRYIRADRGGPPETAAQITAANAWAEVVAVQVDFTVVSDSDNVRTETATTTVAGTPVTDRRLRLTSSFVVNLRNPRV